MSCSHVTPMPPWICTQSWMISADVVADVGLGDAGQRADLWSSAPDSGRRRIGGGDGWPRATASCRRSDASAPDTTPAGGRRSTGRRRTRREVEHLGRGPAHLGALEQRRRSAAGDRRRQPRRRRCPRLRRDRHLDIVEGEPRRSGARRSRLLQRCDRDALRSRGTRNWVRPSRRRRRTSRWSAWPAASTLILVPLKRNPSPLGSATIEIVCRRQLPCGSWKHQAATTSPSTSPASTLGLLLRAARSALSANATTLTGRNGPGATVRPNSSATMTRSRGPSPETEPPPSASVTSIEVQPSSAPGATRRGRTRRGARPAPHRGRSASPR